MGAIISINSFKKKILLLFPLKKSERVTFDSSLYVPLVANGETITKEMLHNVLKE